MSDLNALAARRQQSQQQILDTELQSLVTDIENMAAEVALELQDTLLKAREFGDQKNLVKLQQLRIWMMSHYGYTTQAPARPQKPSFIGKLFEHNNQRR